MSCTSLRIVAAGLAVAALISAAWFLPPPGKTVQRLDVPVADSFGQEALPITIFHTADELKAGLTAAEQRGFPEVDWSTNDVLRVRCRAVGYRIEGETEPRFGTLEHSTRLGGTRVYIYLYEPTPHWLYSDVNSVFTQFHREAWFVAPNGVHVVWGSSTMAWRDLVCGTSAVVLSLACGVVALSLLRQRRRPATAEVVRDRAPAEDFALV